MGLSPESFGITSGKTPEDFGIAPESKGKTPEDFGIGAGKTPEDFGIMSVSKGKTPEDFGIKGEEDSWAKTIGKVAVRSGLGIGQTATGGAQYLGEADEREVEKTAEALSRISELDTSSWTGKLKAVPAFMNLTESMVKQMITRPKTKEIGKGLGEAGEKGTKAIAETKEEFAYNLRDKSAKWWVANGTEGAMTTMVPAVVASAMTKNPAVGMRMIFPQALGLTYGEDRLQGDSALEAGDHAMYTAVVETLSESIPLKYLDEAKGVLKKIAAGTLSEAAQEGLMSEVAQIGYEIAEKGENVTWAEAWNRIVTSAGLGAVGGTGMGVTSAMIDREPDSPKKLGKQIEQEDSDLIKSLLSRKDDIVAGTAMSGKGVTAKDKSQIEAIDKIIKETRNPKQETYWQDKVSEMTEGTKKVAGSMAKGADYFLGVASTRLYNIDPSIKLAVRHNIESELTNIQQDSKNSKPLLKAIKEMTSEAKSAMNTALTNGDKRSVDLLSEELGVKEEVGKVRKVLDDIHKRAKEVGLDMPFLENYFPRIVKDYKGLSTHLTGTDQSGVISKSLKKEEQIQKAQGKEFTEEDQAAFINAHIRGYGKHLTLSLPHANNRTIDIVTEDIEDFYMEPSAALVAYINRMNKTIEARKFFGGEKKVGENEDAEDAIGDYVQKLMDDGKVKPEQEAELVDILRSLFYPQGTGAGTSFYKNMEYIDTMGSPISAVTQIGDIAFPLYKTGFINTAKALANAIRRNSEIVKEDVGIERILAEYEDAGIMGRAVDRVFKLTGLTAMDNIGKETMLNASVAKYRKLAKKKPEEARRMLEPYYGKETGDLIVDLQSGKMTENVKFLAFNELLDVQPVALSEVPQGYLNARTGRLFYMLKTYTIKVFDVYRQDAWNNIKSGDKTKVKKGVKNLLLLTTMLMTMNAGADKIKDLILNRETSWTDLMVDNFLRVMGLSKYTIYKARREGFVKALFVGILPPFKFIDSVLTDLWKAVDDPKGIKVKDLRAISSVPLGGKIYDEWYGGRSKRKKKKKEKSKGYGGY